MFDKSTERFAEMRMHDKGCEGHLEFRLASGNAGTGRASEAHLNMDVNLRRLPERTKCKSKFPVPLAGFMLHPHPADSAVLPSKQAERQFTIKKNMH